MKNLLLVIIVLFLTTNILAQDSKAYIGVGLGYAIPGGDAMIGVDNGIELGIVNFGYRFDENWGATINLVSSGHTLEATTDVAWGLAYYGVGPMYTTSLSDNISLDVKPQAALGMVGVYVLESNSANSVLGLDGAQVRGSGFVLGNSLVFGSERGLKFSVNFDYLFGNWKTTKYTDGSSFDWNNLGYATAMSKLSLGLGLRFNF
jgi:hypothetical protein